ncbi:hypothetical protein [uncultured Mucilaginibacter sp.]|uniref:hypothetical protein n=1 Tax=uncultured Mucilaginibacter sp. TaxID=797541 RepID=UPI0025D4A6CC|nr:hypothetical protein [uncultured Mucilaginibacter sp.]
MIKSLLFSAVIIFLFMANCQVLQAQQTNGVVIFHIYSTHTSFPDTGRSKGHFYDSVLYSAKEHYNDSTVLIIAPKNLDAKKKVDLIFWFHGWRNNVDHAAVEYELTKQFIESKRNAVLVLAETARDSPDSYGGKLEKPGDFKALVSDVLQGLKDKYLVSENCVSDHILLGGHSGAYEVMAMIIKNGGVPIDEAMLFDSLYGKTEIFMEWIKADKGNRFIHLYTDVGYGPKEESERMNKLLDTAKISYFMVEEKDLKPGMYDKYPLIYIHSLKQHNDIVNPDNFRLMLEHTPFLKQL